jgi:adenosylcobyric acid synthase
MTRKTPSLMIQGTCSNAGKSLLVAGICRALANEGVRVAPFKAQNMSLNSFVTLRGEEIGRAQALQAQACGLEPRTEMNPVLLKPNSQTGAQVVVRGKPVGSMPARDYFAFKTGLFATVRECYDTLAAEHDVVVLEGAGSPAEINLKAHDIVNMRMAAHAGARVLIVADIDRGGAFASLIGTMACLDDWERELTAGFVLNKFRGDAGLLGDALEFTTGRTGRPFFGVLPHLADLGLPEEDSVGFKERGFAPGADKAPDALDIACVDLAHVSNFTDFDALALEPDVRLRLVADPTEIRERRPDCVIIPGSKNTLADLGALRASGLAEGILDFAASGGHVVGICAGFQMLGERIADPLGLESGHGLAQGLGLLPMATELKKEKTLARTRAHHLPSGCTSVGYEIHHGRTEMLGTAGEDIAAVLVSESGPIGFANGAGLVWGCYLHGLFDEDEFRRAFLDRLREAAGLPPIGRVVARYRVEEGLDRLALAITEHLDWPRIKELIGL